MSDAPFVPALALADFPATGMASITINGWRIAVARVGDTFFAVNDRCTRAASPLSTGRLRHGIIMCPLHGARFDLANGKCLGGGFRPVRSFPVRLAGDTIEIAVPADQPGLDEAPLGT